MESGKVVPEPRFYNGVCMINVGHYIIMHVGYLDDDSDYSRALFGYDTITGIWRRYHALQDTEYCYNFSSICATGNSIYIFGGTDLSVSLSCTNSLVSFDMENAKWQTLSPHIEDHDKNTPPPLGESCIFYYNGFLYVLGGIYCNEFVNKMYKFCLKTSTWSLVVQKGQKPLLQGHIFGTVFKNKFYLFGGSSVTGPNGFRDVMIFDFSTNTWTLKATRSKNHKYPEDREENSFSFSSNYGYLSGGKISNTFFSDIWKIDLESLKWFKLEYSLTPGLDIYSSCIFDDSYLYILGGHDSDSEQLKVFKKLAIRPVTRAHRLT